MTERRETSDLHVVDAGGETALEERADLRGEEHRLGSAGGGPKFDILLDHLRRAFALGVRAEEQANGVVLHVARDGHLAHEALHLQDLVAGQHR